MRGEPKQQETMLSLVTPAKRVPAEHPIRRIKELADAELLRLSPVFDEMYSGKGRPSIPPERLDRQKRNGIRPRTLGADKAYDTSDFIADLRTRGITPHVAQNQTRRRSAIDQRTTRHPGYALSQRYRKKVEEIFGWGKVIGGLRKTRFRGVQRTGLWGHLSMAAYNLLRLAKLLPRPAPA